MSQNMEDGYFFTFTNAKNFGKKICHRFFILKLEVKYFFSWRSAIGSPTEPSIYSAIRYLEYGKQKRKQTKNADC